MLRKTGNILTYILILTVLLLLAAFLGVRLLHFVPYAVNLDAATAEVERGALVYTKTVPAEGLSENALIAYQASDSEKLLTGRIASSDPIAQYFLMENSDHVRYENLRGRVDFTLPLLGYLYAFLQKSFGMNVAAFGCFLLLLLFQLPEIVHGFVRRREMKLSLSEEETDVEPLFSGFEPGDLDDEPPLALPIADDAEEPTDMLSSKVAQVFGIAEESKKVFTEQPTKPPSFAHHRPIPTAKPPIDERASTDTAVKKPPEDESFFTVEPITSEPTEKTEKTEKTPAFDEIVLPPADIAEDIIPEFNSSEKSEEWEDSSDYLDFELNLPKELLPELEEVSPSSVDNAAEPEPISFEKIITYQRRRDPSENTFAPPAPEVLYSDNADEIAPTPSAPSAEYSFVPRALYIAPSELQFELDSSSPSAAPPEPLREPKALYIAPEVSSDNESFAVPEAKQREWDIPVEPKYIEPEPIIPPKPTYAEPEPIIAPKPTYVEPEPIIAPKPTYVEPDPIIPPKPTYVEPEPIIPPKPTYVEPDPIIPPKPTYVESEPIIPPKPTYVESDPIIAPKPMYVEPDPIIPPKPTYVEPEPIIAPDPPEEFDLEEFDLIPPPDPIIDIDPEVYHRESDHEPFEPKNPPVYKEPPLKIPLDRDKSVFIVSGLEPKRSGVRVVGTDEEKKNNKK